MILILNNKSQEPKEINQEDALLVLARILRDLEKIGGRKT